MSLTICKSIDICIR